MAKMTPWTAMVAGFKAEGVKHVFGLPGHPANLYFDLYDSPGINSVLVREETSAVFMAYAYSKMSGQPGVVFASPGPGMANLVPGLLEAYSGCIPIIAICGTVSTTTEGMGAFQEADQLGMAKPVTKWAARLERPERLPWLLRRAFQVAMSGKPGPVYIEIPFDIGQMQVEMPPYRKAERDLRPAADPKKVAEAAELILNAKRPMIVAGGGAALSRASAEIGNLVDLLGIPIMTTPSGRGIISEEHPLALGQVGLYLTRAGKKAFFESDLIIGVGSRNEEFQSGEFRFFPEGGKYIQIDIDPFEIGRNWMPDVAIVGDAKLAVGQVVSEIKAKLGSRPVDKSRAEEVAASKKQFLAQIAEEAKTEAVPIKTPRILYEINQVFGHDTILVNENGGQDLWSYMSPYYRVMDVGDCVAPAEQTCMGFGVAGAIGAKLAAPQKKVICTTGDGAFQMLMKEIITAAELKAGVTWIVLNNHVLGWPRWLQHKTGKRYLSTEFTVHSDFTKIAEASGCQGERVERPEQIKGALERALAANQKGIPAVIDFGVTEFDYSEHFLVHDDEVAARAMVK